MNQAILKQFINNIIKDFFYFSFVLLFVLGFLEFKFVGLVSNYVNINIILIICIFCSVLLSFTNVEKKKTENLRVNLYLQSFFVIILAVLGAYVVWFYSQDFGVTSYFGVIASFISILFIGFIEIDN